MVALNKKYTTMWFLEQTLIDMNTFLHFEIIFVAEIYNIDKEKDYLKSFLNYNK